MLRGRHLEIDAIRVHRGAGGPPTARSGAIAHRLSHVDVLVLIRWGRGWAKPELAGRAGHAIARMRHTWREGLVREVHEHRVLGGRAVDRAHHRHVPRRGVRLRVRAARGGRDVRLGVRMRSSEAHGILERVLWKGGLHPALVRLSERGLLLRHRAHHGGLPGGGARHALCHVLRDPGHALGVSLARETHLRGGGHVASDLLLIGLWRAKTHRGLLLGGLPELAGHGGLDAHAEATHATHARWATVQTNHGAARLARWLRLGRDASNRDARTWLLHHAAGKADALELSWTDPVDVWAGGAVRLWVHALGILLEKVLAAALCLCLLKLELIIAGRVSRLECDVRINIGAVWEKTHVLWLRLWLLSGGRLERRLGHVEHVRCEMGHSLGTNHVWADIHWRLKGRGMELEGRRMGQDVTMMEFWACSRGSDEGDCEEGG